jgi:hypothetical protein
MAKLGQDGQLFICLLLKIDRKPLSLLVSVFVTLFVSFFAALFSVFSTMSTPPLFLPLHGPFPETYGINIDIATPFVSAAVSCEHRQQKYQVQ